MSMAMKYHHFIWITIYNSFFVRTNSDHLYFGHRFRTDLAGNDFTLYVFEMTSLRSIQDCVDSCKSKKQCKIVNYDSLAKICYHIGSTRSSPFDAYFNLEDFQEEKKGFSFGIKREWNMTGYEDCETCEEIGVCSQNADSTLSKCQSSGCKVPEEKSNAIFHGNMFSISNKIEYECMAGYKTNATFPLRSTCLSNGTWSSLDFECLPEAVFGSDIYKHQNNYYKVSQDLQQWHEANTSCNERKMHLVYIKTPDEYDFISETLNGYTHGCYWIGGYRGVNEVLYWLDGSILETTKWSSSQPDFFNREQYCVQLLTNSLFNDKQCSDMCASICEMI